MDNAFVVAEATGRYCEAGMPVTEAAIKACGEVSGPRRWHAYDAVARGGRGRNAGGDRRRASCNREVSDREGGRTEALSSLR